MTESVVAVGCTVEVVRTRSPVPGGVASDSDVQDVSSAIETMATTESRKPRLG